MTTNGYPIGTLCVLINTESGVNDGAVVEVVSPLIFSGSNNHMTGRQVPPEHLHLVEFITPPVVGKYKRSSIWGFPPRYLKPLEDPDKEINRVTDKELQEAL